MKKRNKLFLVLLGALALTGCESSSKLSEDKLVTPSVSLPERAEGNNANNMGRWTEITILGEERNGFSGAAFNYRSASGKSSLRFNVKGKQYSELGRLVSVSDEVKVVDYRVHNEFCDQFGCGHMYEIELEPKNGAIESSKGDGFGFYIINGEKVTNYYASPSDLKAIL